MTDLLWSEEYRPKVISDCILPEELKTHFQEIVKRKYIPNMLLSGSSGLGKTTVARALCNELNADYILINGSEDSGIDVLRNKIRQFASTQSLIESDSKQKIVIIDEADYLNAASTQPALRGFIDEFNAVCRFIFTCNFKNRMLDAIQSRCTCIDFITNKDTKKNLALQFHKRMRTILQENNIEYDSKVLAQIVIQHAPDWRRVLNECQRYSCDGTLTPKSGASLSGENVDTLISYLKEKDFKNMRIWVGQNTDIDTNSILRRVYDSLSAKAEPKSIPAAVLILADYQYKSAFVADQEINTVACFTELMADIKWK
jgi:DNA polymerase III delta prime subunit